MGILDDAIRQHLELKRRHGAENTDLERLEKEAFGPATRPGDPEFADPGSEAADGEPFTGSEGSTASAPPAADGSSEVEIADWLGSEDATTVQPAEAAPPPADTADHPAPVQLGPEDEAEPTAAELPPPTPAPVDPGPDDRPIQDSAATEPPEPLERDIFDGDEFDFGDLDFGLDEDEDPAALEQPAAAPPPTTDHDLAPAPIEPPSTPEPAPAPESVPPPAEEPNAGEDLLEETPDFLQDAPEGEDLWFEQGPPRDFDFDDD